MLATVAPFKVTLPLLEVILAEASIPLLELLAPLTTMLPLAKIAELMVTPIEVVARSTNLLVTLAVI